MQECHKHLTNAKKSIYECHLTPHSATYHSVINGDLNDFFLPTLQILYFVSAYLMINDRNHLAVYAVQEHSRLVAWYERKFVFSRLLLGPLTDCMY
jgi:hypothetical protein